MTENELPTVNFFDTDAQDDGIAIVRRCGDRLSLALSLKRGGDLQVTLDHVAARKLVEALTAAIRQLDG